MNKQIAQGSLVGILLGTIVYFFSPSLLTSDLLYNIGFRQSQGFSEGQYFYSGSVFLVGTFLPFLFGIIGGFIGFLISRRK